MIKKTRLSGLGVFLSFLTSVSFGQEFAFTYVGNPDNQLGFRVAPGGDINADGVPDFLVADHLEDGQYANQGAVYAYSGADGSLLYKWQGFSTATWFGFAIDGLGDVNLDGFDDVLISASAEWSGVSYGTVRIFSGKDGTVLRRFGDPYHSGFGGNFGWAAAGIGDINHDQSPDYVIGDNSQVGVGTSGKAYVFSGLDGALLKQHWGGEAELFGSKVAGGGDINADGTPDYLVHGSIDPNPVGIRGGKVYAYSGATFQLLYEFEGRFHGDNLGHSLDIAGDVNADGYADILAATFYSAFHPSYAWLLSGMDGSLLYEFDWGTNEEWVGAGAVGLGDVNGDGFDDVAIGDSLHDGLFQNGGEVRIYSGQTGDLLYGLHGTKPGLNFGRVLNRVGDLNQDGRDDVLIGCPTAESMGAKRGLAAAVLLTPVAETRVVNLIAGQTAYMETYNATPFARIHFYSTVHGLGFHVLHASSRVYLNLAGPVDFAGSSLADPTGHTSKPVQVPLHLAGTRIHLQALELPNGQPPRRGTVISRVVR